MIRGSRKRRPMFRVTVEEQRAALPSASFDALGHARQSWRSYMMRVRSSVEPGPRAKFLAGAAIWRRHIAAAIASRRGRA